MCEGLIDIVSQQYVGHVHVCIVARLCIIGCHESAGGQQAVEWVVQKVAMMVKYRQINKPAEIFDTPDSPGLLDLDSTAKERRSSVAEVCETSFRRSESMP